MFQILREKSLLLFVESFYSPHMILNYIISVMKIIQQPRDKCSQNLNMIFITYLCNYIQNVNILKVVFL